LILLISSEENKGKTNFFFQSLFSYEKEHWKERVEEQAVSELPEVIISLRKI